MGTLSARGLRPEQIADQTGLSTTRIGLILNHPPVIEWINKLKRDAANLMAARYDEIDKILEQAIKVHSEVLNDEEATPATRLKAVEMAYDRHPSGTFTKRTQHDFSVDGRIERFDNDELEKLKSEAVKRGYVPWKDATQIEAEVSDVEEEADDEEQSEVA